MTSNTSLGKFGVGDKVHVVHAKTPSGDPFVGKSGIVRGVKGQNTVHPITVFFDPPVRIWNGTFRSTEIFAPEELEIVNNATEERADSKIISDNAKESTGKFAGYHGHPDFYKLLEEVALLHSTKNHDYCPGADPLGNFKSSAEDAGVEPWIGVLIRLGDKISRLRSFAKKGRFKVNNESVEDTFKDMATYALLGLLCYREGKTNESA